MTWQVFRTQPATRKYSVLVRYCDQQVEGTIGCMSDIQTHTASKAEGRVLVRANWVWIIPNYSNNRVHYG